MRGLEVRDDDDKAAPGREADDYRVRNEIDKAADPENSERQFRCPHHESEGHRQLHIVG
jgi:hypothetical protein